MAETDSLEHVLHRVSIEELLAKIYDKYLALRSSSDNTWVRRYSELERSIPAKKLYEWGMKYRSASEALDAAIGNLPVLIVAEESRMNWYYLRDNGRRSTLRRINGLSIRNFDFDKDIKFDYARAQFGVKTNTILKAIPSGFVRILMGWDFLKFETAKRAAYVEKGDIRIDVTRDYEGIVSPRIRGGRSIEFAHKRYIEDHIEELDSFMELKGNESGLNVRYCEDLLTVIDDAIELTPRSNRVGLASLYKYQRHVRQMLLKHGFEISESGNTIVREFFPVSK